jgi:hypothetical protein
MMDAIAMNEYDSTFAIATNASLADGDMLSHTIPSWLRVFGNRLVEIAIIVDDAPLTGRIADLHHGLQDKEKIYSVLQGLTDRYSRVNYKKISDLPIEDIQRKWFGSAAPNRCHVGSPILPFVAGIESVSEDLVLHCDSDMLFYEAGWVDLGFKMLNSGEIDIYEPPRIVIEDYVNISSRAFMISRSRFSTRLPLKHLYVDTARRIYRTLQRRPTFVSLETMLERAIANQEIVWKRGTSPGNVGWTVHAPKRSFAQEAWFANALKSIEQGSVPDVQRETWNLNPAAWTVTSS